MIVVNIRGGLGNQMFQYAFGRAIAVETNQDLVLDLNWFINQEKREFQISEFNIDAAKLNRYCARLISYQFGASNVGKRVSKSVCGEYEYIDERNIIGTAAIKEASTANNSYLQGYWQSETYFSNASNVVRGEFQLRSGLSEQDAKLAARMCESNSVSIHVRRGDYISDPSVRRVHGVLPMGYYRKAIKLVQREVGSVSLFLFSDHPDWCRENLALGNEMIIVSDGGRSAPHELTLMSKCRHHIIANSSFSWWGAWLSDYPRKRVIAPTPWFRNSSSHLVNRCPKEWQLIDVNGEYK